jgi:hypothetical protein
MRSGLGWRTFPAPPGTGSELALALSPIGRVHVLGANGAYTHSDDDGQTWSEPLPVLPPGHAPRLLLQPDGFAQAFILSADGSLYTARQTTTGWSAPEVLAGGVRAYDATMDGGQGWLVVTGEAATHLYRDGQQVASWEGADFVPLGGDFTPLNGDFTSVTARDGHVVVGLGRDYWAAVAWQNADGGDWQFCVVQEITVAGWTGAGKARIGQVYGVAAWRQGQIVTLWNWAQPGHENRGDYPYIVVGHTPQDRCDPFPAVHDAQNLYPQFAGPPGLFATLSPQAYFSLALDGEQGLIAFEGLQWNGKRDIYVAEFHPDAILSFGYAGGAQ